MAALPSIAALIVLGTTALLASAPDTILVQERVFGSFQRATRLVTSPQGWIYVVDADRNTIVLFKDQDSSPSFVGGYGWTATTFAQPTGIATDGLNVYVSDLGNHRIQRFDRFLNYISSFSTRDTDVVSARFGYPAGVALSRLGDLFILDTENLRVVKYAGSGKFERSFGGIHDERGKLRRPLKILAGQNDYIYILEPERLLQYDYFGNFIQSIGVGVLGSARGFDVVGSRAVVLSQDTLYWFSERGEVTLAIPVRFIVTSAPIGEVEDIALVRDRLYLLTSQKVFTLEIHAVD
ncbi:MAG: NHL repeat-containing protein [Bacteroidota bacterium]